jgi:hypothetical protein
MIRVAEEYKKDSPIFLTKITDPVRNKAKNSGNLLPATVADVKLASSGVSGTGAFR